ncbi:MAG TPA: helix-turn-helix domain-containing protein [Novosphingobium sp.]
MRTANDIPAKTAPRDRNAEAIFSQLAGRWALQILMALGDGPLRFTDLRHAIPKVSANILTARLRELEAAGLVERGALPPPAAVQVYALAPLARELAPALDHLARWKESLSADTDRAVGR